MKEKEDAKQRLLEKARGKQIVGDDERTEGSIARKGYPETGDLSMSTADPPDVLISPTRGSTSLGETRVLDGSMKVLVEGSSVEDGSTEKSPTISNLGVANSGISPGKVETSVVENGSKEKTPVDSNLDVSKEGSKNSWVGVVQGQKEGEIRKVQSEEKGEKERKEEDKTVHMENKEEEKKFKEVERNTEKEKELEWSEITPGKASRSPNTSQRELEYDQVSLITKSRFSVLSPDEGMQDNEESVEQIAVQSTLKLKEKEEVRVLRQVLPRDSKLNHRYLGDKGGHSNTVWAKPIITRDYQQREREETDLMASSSDMGSADFESLSSTSDVELLKRAWRNEKAAPEILPYEGDLVERAKGQIELVEENIDAYVENGIDPLVVSLYQMDLDRTQFLLRSYLRVRLLKVCSFD
ncbi:hypothetical protein DY000_02025682 [Brassica cretica]|uniref:Uncharacterized protein n=1 Tax=Brassica cretica TaxID=69181 RepID=A0ABQ7EER2_BRACR|nr:hypothetical protein DY000_02025682 [Brassica cretica]